MSRRILLVQLFSNGDCLYATAIARQIKHDFPGCHLTWAIAPFCRAMLLGNPYVDAVTEVTDVPKSDVIAYRAYKKRIRAEQKAGNWDEVFFTVNMDENQAYYDGCIRTNILRAYPGRITEGIQPVMHFSDEERRKVDKWVRDKGLSEYRRVILFEFAPQSGQALLTGKMALDIAQDLVKGEQTAVILSSANRIQSVFPGVIDGSELSYRESVYLSNHCTMLIGCSSGITWGTTSNGGKMLPMIQLLNADTVWLNPISRDFKRQGISTEGLIELNEFTSERIVACVQDVFRSGFPAARQRYNQQVPLQFKTTRRIVYNLLCYLKLRAIGRHLRINASVWGWHPLMLKEAALAILLFPFTLVRNRIRKRGQG